MRNTLRDSLLEIEEAQAALRDSIEKTKALAAESDRLLRQYHPEPGDVEPPNPAV